MAMGFPRQEYWNGLPFPSRGDLPNLGIEPIFPALQANSLPMSHQLKCVPNAQLKQGIEKMGGDFKGL